MDRRAFFTKGAGKVAQKLTQHAADKARKDSARWIRPPFAIEELDFILACTRCGDCIKACPYGIIFPLSSKLGVKVFNTPALDLTKSGCHLCEDWPCVTACEIDVLKLPLAANKSELDETEEGDREESDKEESAKEESEREDPLPKLAIVSINTETCLPYSGPECGACRVCPIEGAMEWNMEKPVIVTKNCTGCGLCREACIVEPKAINIQSKYKS